MANNHSHQLKTKPRNPCFLGCFGFSRRDKKVPVNLSVKAVESYSNNTIARSKKLESSGANLFSWSRFRMKNVSAVKTVPIPVVTAEIHSSKSKSKSKSKRRFLMIFTKRQHHHPKSTTSKTMSFHEIPAAAKVAKDDAPKEISQLEETPEQNIILQKRRSLDHVDSSKGDTCQRRSSFRRKIDAIRIGSSQPGSPDVIVTTKAKPARTASMLSYSVSLPAPTRGKRANPSSHKLDPVVGMSIVMVTLIIMLIWGRLCAILCTSAWCYFVPRLLASSKTKDVMMGINGDPDINSEEHKKRVVLEGFLERDHRVVL